MAIEGSKVEAIYFAALEQPSPEDCARFLDEACANDPSLRQRVEALLNARPKLGTFLQGHAADMVAATPILPTSECPGTQIGWYKLLQQIGEGGMGTVYMAEQTQPVQRKVAIKVIKPGMDSRQVIARFEAERQALAMMDHVNIARVLDAGATDQGRPYFVMELVHGVPITKFCDDNRLIPRQRLELFVPVCQAIQHAHQKGIIHRDIKPSNVMITLYDGKPVPKVIDFGVAKATEQKLTERTLFTQYGTMVGTLEYMSPEQAEMSALGVDTRSDIYSLGVLLYELLTGSTPLTHKRMKDAAYAEILRLIKEEEPPKPSTRLSDSGEALASISALRHTEPAKLSKLMRGELDWIVMKTLEKDRNRRYETANGFAADLKRYLNDEPVQACPPSAGYRFHKYARRNKRILATTGILALTLVLGTSVSVWQAIRATQAEGLAEERSESAKASFDAAEEQRRRVQDQLLLTEQARNVGLQRLYEARLAEAKAGSLSRRSGQRIDSLKALTEAAALARELKLPAENDLLLRNAAVACLALPDLRIAKEWPGWPRGSDHIDFDGTLERYARTDGDGAVSIRRVTDDAEIAHLPATGGGAWPLLSRNGRFLGVASVNGLRVYSLLEPEPELLLEFAAGIASQEFSADSRLFVAGHDDGSTSIHDLVSGEPARRLQQGVPGRHLVLDPGNQAFAIACDATVEIRDFLSGDVTATLPHPAPVNQIVWHPDGRTIAVACTDLTVYLWDTTSRKTLFVIDGFKNGGIYIAFNHSGDLLAATSWDGKMRLWDTRTGRQLFSTTGGCNAVPRFSADDRFLSVNLHDGKLGIWEVVECREYRTLVHTSAEQTTPYYNPTVFGDGLLLAAGLYGGVGVWELSSGRELSFFDLPGVHFTAAENSKGLLTNGSAGLLRWSVTRESSVPKRMRIGPPKKLALPGSVYDIACSRDGHVIASAQSNGALALHADKPDHPVPLIPHADVRYVSVSPDGKWVATGSHNAGAVNIWNSESGALVKSLPGVSWRAIFSPDGKWLGSVAGGFRLWKVGSWVEGPKVGGGEGAAFSPDSSLLAVESGEGSIRLVDPNTGNEYARLSDPHQDRARHMTFSSDGARLIATNDDSMSIHVWDLRIIRQQLDKLGLDWSLPSYPLPESTDSLPQTVEFSTSLLGDP